MALVEAELGVRRAAGAYSGKFAGLAHYFGYEGRCALPTNFDATCGRFLPTFLSCVQHSSIACRPCCQTSCCPHASGRGGASAPERPSMVHTLPHPLHAHVKIAFRLYRIL